MNLYFIADTFIPEFNRDLLVWAETYDQAEEMWRDYYGLEEGHPEKIFMVDMDAPIKPTTLGWHSSVTLVKEYAP